MKTALSFLTLWLAAGLATAQELPQKTITLVVGFVAGGGADTAARIIAKKVADNLKQTVVIDNRAGAGGNLAHQYVATAPPDGSIILLGSVGPLAVAPHMMKVGYDPLKDLAPLTMGVTFPNVLVVQRRRSASRRWPSTSPSPRRSRAASTTPPPAPARPRTWPASSSTRRPGSRSCTFPTRAARRRCRTCSAAGSRPTSRCRRPPSRTSRPASWCRWRRPAWPGRPSWPTCRRSPSRAFPASTRPTGTPSSRPARPRRPSSIAGTASW